MNVFQIRKILMNRRNKMNKKRRMNNNNKYIDPKTKCKEVLQLLQNKNVISFGFNCFVKIFLKKINLQQETHFFDWIGSSMWSIRKIFQDNFHSFHSPDEMTYKHIMNSGKQYTW